MRLIDADELKKAIIELDLDNTSHWSVIYKIDNAPTVPTVCSTRIASVVDMFGNLIEGYFDESRMLFFSGYGIVTAELIKQKNYKLIFEEGKINEID